MPDEELGGQGEGPFPVLAPGEEVALVGEELVVDLAAVGANPVDDLVALRLRDPRVVGALDDEQGSGDPVGVGQW
jgi:hypothetical protein